MIYNVSFEGVKSFFLTSSFSCLESTIILAVTSRGTDVTDESLSLILHAQGTPALQRDALFVRFPRLPQQRRASPGRDCASAYLPTEPSAKDSYDISLTIVSGPEGGRSGGCSREPIASPSVVSRRAPSAPSRHKDKGEIAPPPHLPPGVVSEQCEKARQPVPARPRGRGRTRAMPRGNLAPSCLAYDTARNREPPAPPRPSPGMPPAIHGRSTRFCGAIARHPSRFPSWSERRG